MDILGKALMDFHQGNYSEDIITTSNITEEDEMPLPHLFRNYAEMPKLEQTALEKCTGKVLDVGCGAGSHSLYLQEKGLDVLAIDISKGAVQVAKARGVQHVEQLDLLKLKKEHFDTILLLMNGTGIFGKVAKVSTYLEHLKTLLNPEGKILIDSSDLQYMYDENEDGSIWVPADRYYGELDFRMTYKGEQSDVFPWLYLDEKRFKNLARKAGLNFEVLQYGNHFDYLAQLKLNS